MSHSVHSLYETFQTVQYSLRAPLISLGIYSDEQYSTFVQYCALSVLSVVY